MGDQIKPTIFKNIHEADAYLSQNPDVECVDIIEGQLKELARISFVEVEALPEHLTRIVGVLYPRSRKLLKCLDEEASFLLRTNRNRELISTEEQQVLRSATVAVAGMSVGSGIALGMAYSGIANTIKIADLDVLDTSNLNRLRESLLHVGRKKVDLVAESIYNVNPFAEVYAYADGVTENNIQAFLNDPKVSVVIDEIDDFRMKVLLRVKAKELGIPLLMFTSLGDNILVDIERYDLDQNTKYFNGLLHDDGQAILENPNIDQAFIRRYSVEVVGQEYIPTKALASVMEMGKTLVGRPQLYSTIAIDGGLAAYTVRKLLLGEELPSGRYFFRVGDIFGLGEKDFADDEMRKQILERLFAGPK